MPWKPPKMKVSLGKYRMSLTMILKTFLKICRCSAWWFLYTLIFIRITELRPEPGWFLISNWNWENLRLTLPEIMGLKCFSQNAESFPLEYRVWKHDLHRFSQKFSPKNEAGDSYKEDSRIKKRCTLACWILLILKWSTVK